MSKEYGKMMKTIKEFADRYSINLNKLLRKMDDFGHVVKLTYHPSLDSVGIIGDEQSVLIPRRELL